MWRERVRIKGRQRILDYEWNRQKLNREKVHISRGTLKRWRPREIAHSGSEVEWAKDSIIFIGACSHKNEARPTFQTTLAAKASIHLLWQNLQCDQVCNSKNSPFPNGLMCSLWTGRFIVSQAKVTEAQPAFVCVLVINRWIFLFLCGYWLVALGTVVWE